ncbi:polysaccharide deacetylase family protein [Falsibacillus pallidus]|uniref:polysaccharide deacetylase family protein n=1 Tax=Falsibacillus pallidus TaxID=493781 RepID=UPI003D9874C5
MKKNLFGTILLLISIFCFDSIADAATRSRAEYEKTGRVIWEVNTKQKIVAITFDDGPHPVFTPQILEILAKHDAKATFFVTGLKAGTYPDLLKREVREGHEIANHTFHHFHGNIASSKLSSELIETDKMIKQVTGLTPKLYRPVGGYYSDVIINTALQNGKTVILWSWDQDSRDWTEPPANQMYRYIKKGIKPGNIILFHDWHGSELTQSCSTVKALDKILDYLDENGYKSVTVSELLYHSTQFIPEAFEIYPLKKEKTSHIDIMY